MTPAGKAQEKEPEIPVVEEPLPNRAYQRLGTTRLRHGSRISSLALSSDGSFVAAGGGNDIVRIWDTKTGMQKRSIGKENWVNAVALSPNDSILATGGVFKKIRLWDAATGNERSVLEGTQSPVKTLAFSPNGAFLASGEQNGMVRLRGMLSNSLEGHSDEVAALAFSPKGSRLASAGCDRTIRLWDTDTNKLVCQIDGGCSVAGLAFSSDGQTLFSAGDDNLIRLWDAATGKAGKVLKGHEDAIVSLSCAGPTLASGGRDRTIRLWNQDDLSLVRVIPCALGDSDALSLSNNGKLLAFAGVNGTIHLVDTETGKERFSNLGAMAPISALSLSQGGGKTLVALAEDGNVNLWDTSTATIQQTLKAGPAGNLSLARALAGHVADLQSNKSEILVSKDVLAVTFRRRRKNVRLARSLGQDRGKLSRRQEDSAADSSFCR